MNKNLVITALVSTFVSGILSAIISVAIVISMNSSNKEVSGKGGYFNLSNPRSATLTGYDWLQLNNKSNNKIQLTNGRVFVTSPNFMWNGETVATREWVEEICK